MLGAAALAADAGEATLKATAIEEALDRRSDDGTQRPPARLVEFVIDREVSLEMPLEDLVEVRALRVTGPVDGRRRGGGHDRQPVARGTLVGVKNSFL